MPSPTIPRFRALRLRNLSSGWFPLKVRFPCLTISSILGLFYGLKEGERGWLRDGHDVRGKFKLTRGFSSPVEVRSREDLLPPGAEPGTVPTDLEQATGLERLEILGKMQGIDIFDMKPLDASRRGALGVFLS